MWDSCVRCPDHEELARGYPMSSEFQIRRLREPEWPAFRRLRLDALRTDALAFGSTYAREDAYPEEKWQSWARDGAQGDQSPTFVIDAGSGNLVGMAGMFQRGPDFVVWGMWVAPSFRGQRLGARLTEALVEWLDRSHPGKRALLSVNPTQTPAVRTYLAHGFVFTGVEEPLGHSPPAIIREMVRGPRPRAR
jgi:ribosomal protein S18 acetylase RimI-like enzyme